MQEIDLTNSNYSVQQFECCLNCKWHQDDVEMSLFDSTHTFCNRSVGLEEYERNPEQIRVDPLGKCDWYADEAF